MFVRHHVHSVMSVRDAMLKLEDIFTVAQENNESVSVCDHGSIASWVQIANICKKKGMKPIFGIEAYINKHRDRLLELVEQINSMGDTDKALKKKLQEERDSIKKYHHIVIVAKNKTGFHNLIELANIGYINGFYGKPTITYEELMKHKEGLVISTACLGSTLNQYLLHDDIESAKHHLEYLKENFGENVFIEVQANNIDDQRKVNKEIIKFSKDLDMKMIIGLDSHYIDMEAKETHQDMLLLQNKNKRSDVGKFDLSIHYETGKGEMKKKKVAPDKEFRKGTLAKDVSVGDMFKKEVVTKIEEVNRVWEFSGDASYQSEDQLKEYINEFHEELIPYIDEIFASNHKLYDMVEAVELDTDIKLPEIENDVQELINMVKASLKEKGLSKKKRYLERAKYELQVIKKNGFSSYFLVLADFIQYAKVKEIPHGAGRGSGASSLVAYLLGIHRIDPLDPRWGHMPFERFLAPGRLSNKIVIFDEDGNKKEFISQDKIKIIRGGEELNIQAKDLAEGDDFVEVIKRFSA